MEPLLKIAYYLLLGLCVIPSTFLFLRNVFASNWDSNLRERIVLLLASGSALGILFWAYQLGHQQGHLGLGIGMIISAILVFAAVMLIGMFTGKINWQ